MTRLAGKVALITGASSGIGRAAALLFAREGAHVVVTARRESELDALVDEIASNGGHAVAVAGDIRDEALAGTLVATATYRFGGLDIAFNNAGTVGELVPLPGGFDQGLERRPSTRISRVRSSGPGIRSRRCSRAAAAR